MWVLAIIAFSVILGLIIAHFDWKHLENQWAKNRKSYLEQQKIKQKRFENLSLEEIDKILKKEEKEREEQSNLIELMYPDLPMYCPSCLSVNIYMDNKLGIPVSKWELASSSKHNEAKFDGSTQWLGVTTIHTKNVTRTTMSYRCPKCGFIHSKTY